jgi:PEP-CTERM motif
MTVKSVTFIAGLSALLLAAPASADVILNTITQPVQPNGAGWTLVRNVSGEYQSIGLSFSSPNATTITEVDAYITDGCCLAGQTAHTVTLGIMADNSGLPSGIFFDSALVTLNANDPVTLSSLNWSIAAGTTYWLAAVASDGTFAGWNYGSDQGVVAYTTSQFSGWQTASDFLPEAEIFAAAVPEPSAWAMMILGFAGIGFMAYQRRNNTGTLRVA